MKSNFLYAFLLLFVLCSLFLVSCEQKIPENADEDQTLKLLYNTEVTSLSTFVNGTLTDWAAISNCIEGLIGLDQFGNKVPALAESWSENQDGTVYTFKIRKNAYWVNYQGKRLDKLKAQDFVTVAKLVCSPENNNSSIVYFKDIIKGATDYINSKTKDFDTVGFKAIDDSTLEITLTGPLPYFLTYCGNYLPVYTPIFNELGKDYGNDNKNICYIGAYRITEYEPFVKRVYVKNTDYWDAKNVHIEKIIMSYNEQSEKIGPEKFLSGEIDYAPVRTEILDTWMTEDETKNIVIPGIPDNVYVFYYGFNFDPKFSDEYEPENWKLAIANENFRQSIYWGLDRLNAKLTNDPYNAEMFLTNTITPVSWCSVNGEDFTQIEPLKQFYDKSNWGYNSKKALEYKEKAIKELKEKGATFPIKIYMPYNTSNRDWGFEVVEVKNQLTDLLGEDYIECIIYEAESNGFLSAYRRSGNYGFMKLNNGASIDDPMAWIIAFQEGNTWTFFDKSTSPEIVSIRDKYYSLIDEGKKIYTKSMERYKKFAEAEALLLEHALVIPYSLDSTGYYVTRLNPFEAIKSTDQRFKYQWLRKEALTQIEWKKLYMQWKLDRKASLK